MNMRKGSFIYPANSVVGGGNTCRFKIQSIGRYCIKFKVASFDNGLSVCHSHTTNACNPYDAAARLTREVCVIDCEIYSIEEIEPVRPVCLSSCGYRLVRTYDDWLCLDTGKVVLVDNDGTVQCVDGEVHYGKLTIVDV